MKSVRNALLLSLAVATAATARAEEPWVDPIDDEAPLQVSDPLEGFNRVVFRFNDAATTYALRPVAKGYRKAVPPPLRRGLSNFLDNLAYPVRLVGNVLQGRFKGAARETGAFLVNSTIGVGGLWDPASRMRSLETPEEDVGQAFGSWGIGDGPYLVLPLLGPSNPRDLVAGFGERWLAPGPYLRDWELQTGLTAANTLSGLPPAIEVYDTIRGSAVDPYIAVRTGFVERRRFQVGQ
jgi:phospholipid-binding lipoprotein MlaA